MCCETSELAESAHALAKRLSIPVISNPRSDFDYLLGITERGWELRSTRNPRSGSLRVDFLAGSLGYRLARPENRQALARAVGASTKPGMYVIDATAGMGRDALIMAQLGCRVLMLERSAVIACLLHDGLLRARKTSLLRKVIEQRIDFTQVDAIAFLQALDRDHRPDVIYLDPMHPQRKKSAMVKKEMRIFREIVGEDEDAEFLLDCALKRAIKRVVVKRPRRGESLPGPPPHHRIVGRSTRYDVYSVSGDC